MVQLDFFTDFARAEVKHVRQRTFCEIAKAGNGVYRVALTQGQSAIVDECDVEKVRPIVWSASTWSGVKTFYARGNMNRGKGKENRKLVQMHQFILDFPGCPIDHINGNGLDNRRKNLRLCTQRLNVVAALQRRAFDGLLGVRWMPHGRYQASIRQNGKYYALGCYDTGEEAGLAYDFASTLINGEFASLNFPGKEIPEHIRAQCLMRLASYERWKHVS